MKLFRKNAIVKCDFNEATNKVDLVLSDHTQVDHSGLHFETWCKLEDLKKIVTTFCFPQLQVDHIICADDSRTDIPSFARRFQFDRHLDAFIVDETLKNSKGIYMACL